MVGESKLSRSITIIVLLLPSFIGLVVFNFIPIVYSAVISFTDWDGIVRHWKFIGVENYTNVFTDERSMQSLLNTFKFIVLYAPIVVIVGLIIAILLDMEIKFVKLYRAMIFIPVITSWVAVSLIWKWIYNEAGLINYVLSLFHIQGNVWLSDPSTAMFAIVIVTVWKDVGFVAIILLAGLQGIAEEYYEASKIDGANALQNFFYITIPSLTPSLFFVIVISLINNFQVFDQVYIMTAGEPMNTTRTLVLELYENAFKMNKVGFASAQAWVLFSVILVITIIQNGLQKRWVNYEA